MKKDELRELVAGADAFMLMEVAAEKANEAKASGALTSPRLVFEYVAGGLVANENEELWVVLLNTKNIPIKKVMVSRGGLNFAAAHPREVFREAVKENAGAIILAHNHPSGDPTPSASDRKITRVLAQAGKLLGITLLDHLIVAGGTYISMKETRPADIGG